MIPEPAQYLLRFDDLCPTMDMERWEAFERLFTRFGVRPILAVVPDNRDPDLVAALPDEDFWARMRWLEAYGAVIGLHGYQHLCVSQHGGRLGLHAQTEFAGVDESVQRRWILSGLDTLRRNGLTPRIWVAPRHGFDGRTLKALRSVGMDCLSDGMARVPFMREGVLWIPQQLWGPMEKQRGVWTICMHSNMARLETLEGLRMFLERYAGQFTSVERVIEQFAGTRLSPEEWLREKGGLLRRHVSAARRRVAARLR